MTPGRWLEFEFTPAETFIHVRTDSVRKVVSDSLRPLRDRLALLPGIFGSGLQDRLAYWINDSTLSLWISVLELDTAVQMARGMRDSTWLGKYSLPTGQWDYPAPVDEPPYPAWYHRDWRRWEKYGLWVDHAQGPLRMYCHAIGDSVVVFEWRLPRAALLDYIGFDSTQNTAQHIGGYVNGEAVVDVADSGATVLLEASPGLLYTHERSITGDTLLLRLALDWERLRDSVEVWAPGGGGPWSMNGSSIYWVDSLRARMTQEGRLYTKSNIYAGGSTGSASSTNAFLTNDGIESSSGTKLEIFNSTSGGRVTATAHLFRVNHPTAGVSFHNSDTYTGVIGKLRTGVLSPAAGWFGHDDADVFLSDETSGINQSNKVVLGRMMILRGYNEIDGYETGIYGETVPLPARARVVIQDGLEADTVRIPTLGNSDTLKYVTTDAVGNLILRDIPTASSSTSTFLDLTDTPSSYTGNAGKVVKVNPGETALTFADDQTGSGSSSITSIMDTTNRVVSDSAYYWFFREMTPQGSMHPSAGGDSLVTKNRIGWKEWEVTWYQMRNNSTTGHLDFNIRSDSANNVAILMWEANGTSVRTSTTLPPYISDATANWTVIWRPNVLGTQAGTTRSGGNAAGATATTLIAAPNSSVRADGYAPIYWTNALLQQPNSGTTAHFFRLRVYYVTPVGTSSDWHVTIENL